MQNYNKIYSAADIIAGDKPSQTLGLVWKNFLPGSKVLDLGCGLGSDNHGVVRIIAQK